MGNIPFMVRKSRKPENTKAVIVIFVLVLLFLWSIGFGLYQDESRYWAPPSRRDIIVAARLYELEIEDVVWIDISGGYSYSSVELDPVKDREDTMQLIQCLRASELECRGRRTGLTHTLKVQLRRDDFTVTLNCDLDPKHAPYVTRNMRSQDLAFVVAEIQKKHKKKPPKQ